MAINSAAYECIKWRTVFKSKATLVLISKIKLSISKQLNFIKSVICSSHPRQISKIQRIPLLSVIKIKIKLYQPSKVNLSYTLSLWCLSIRGMPVASERLIRTFTSAVARLEEYRNVKERPEEQKHLNANPHTQRNLLSL